MSESGRRLHVDAMSSFGGIPIDLGRVPLTSLSASANKCLEGAPGVGFVIARTDHLAGSAGNAHAVSLDLHAQWAGLEANGQWRFTPPTHILAALDAALDALDGEGGVAGRFARYWGELPHAGRRHAGASASRRCWTMPCRRRSS